MKRIIDSNIRVNKMYGDFKCLIDLKWNCDKSEKVRRKECANKNKFAI